MSANRTSSFATGALGTRGRCARRKTVIDTKSAICYILVINGIHSSLYIGVSFGHTIMDAGQVCNDHTAQTKKHHLSRAMVHSTQVNGKKHGTT